MTAVLPSRARALVDRFPTLRIVVVGDVMLDEFIVGRVTRISPEAPVPVVEFQSRHFRLGGAANVAHNVVALGGTVDLVGVVGEDAEAEQVRRELAGHRMDPGAVVAVSDRPTTRKTRIVTTRNQQVARVDYESDADVPANAEDALIARLGDLLPHAAVVVVSDYLKGVVTARLMRFLGSECGTASVPLLVDPKIPHLGLYAGASLVTPNHHEAQTATAMRIRTLDETRAAAREFRLRCGCASVLITLGEHGMWLLEEREATRGQPPASSAAGTGDLREAHFPAVAREVADVTGAGDTVIATMALAVGAGASLAEAATLANHAAGVVVGHFGPATVSPREILASVGDPGGAEASPPAGPAT